MYHPRAHAGDQRGADPPLHLDVRSALYATARFVIEFYRGDPRGSVFHGALSTSQFIAALLFLTALLIAPYLLKTQRVTAQASPPDAA